MFILFVTYFYVFAMIDLSKSLIDILFTFILIKEKSKLWISDLKN